MSLHRIPTLLSFAIIAISLFSPLLASGLTSTFDRMGYGFGNQAVLLNSTNEVIEPGDFHAQLHDFAANNDVTITLKKISANIPEGEEHYFSTGLLNKDPQRLPAFGNDVTRIVSSFQDLEGFDNRGIYTLDGPDGSAEKFLNWAQSIGLDGTVMQNNFWNILGQSPYLKTGFLMLLAVLFLAATHEITRSRSTAVKRLLGRPLVRSLFDDHVLSWKTSLAATVLSLLSTVVILGIYSLAQVELFYTLYFSSFVLGILCLLIGQVIGHFLAVSVPLASAIKGERSGLLLTTGMSFTRIVALFLSLIILGNLSGNSSELKAHNLYSDTWKAHDSAYEISIASATGSDFYQLADKLRQMDQRGEVLLADPDWITWPMDLGAPVVLSNKTFALEEGLIDSKDLPNNDEVVVLHPEILDESSEAEIIDMLTFEASLAEVAVPEIRSISHIQLSEVFTYNTENISVVANPIVVMLPEGLRILSDQNLSARLTRNSLLIKDEQAVNSLLSSAEAKDYVGSVSPVIDTWQQKLDDLTKTNQITMFNALFALVLTTVLVLATALVFHLRNQKRLWVAYLLGTHPLKSRSSLVFLEIFFALLPGVWLAHRYYNYSSAVASNAPSSEYLAHANSISPGLLVTLIILMLGWAIASLLVAMKLPFEKRAR